MGLLDVSEKPVPSLAHFAAVSAGVSWVFFQVFAFDVVVKIRRLRWSITTNSTVVDSAALRQHHGADFSVNLRIISQHPLESGSITVSR